MRMKETLNNPVVQGTGAGIGVFLVFGLVSDLIPNPVFVRMVATAWWDYMFLTLTAVLAGVYIWQRATLTTETGDYAATGSTLGGFLAFACPICNKALLLLLGASTAMTVFDPLRPFLGAASLLLFVSVIYYQRRNACTSCGERTIPVQA